MVKIKAKRLDTQGVEMKEEVEGFQGDVTVECLSIISNTMEILRTKCHEIPKELILNDVKAIIEQVEEEDWNDKLDL